MDFTDTQFPRKVRAKRKCSERHASWRAWPASLKCARSSPEQIHSPAARTLPWWHGMPPHPSFLRTTTCSLSPIRWVFSLTWTLPYTKCIFEELGVPEHYRYSFTYLHEKQPRATQPVKGHQRLMNSITSGSLSSHIVVPLYPSRLAMTIRPE